VRKNNFIRIFPSKNSEVYERYFSVPRPSNKVLHKYLFSDDLVSYPHGYPSQYLNQPLSQYNTVGSSSPNPTQQNESPLVKTEQNLFSSPNMHQLASQTQFGSNFVPQQDLNSQAKFGNTRTSSAKLKQRQESTGSKKLLPTAINTKDEIGIQKGHHKEKLLITGDDVLIEYVGRLMIAVKSIKEHMLRPLWKNQIEKFIKHYVWHSSDVRRAENNKLW